MINVRIGKKIIGFALLVIVASCTNIVFADHKVTIHNNCNKGISYASDWDPSINIPAGESAQPPMSSQYLFTVSVPGSSTGGHTTSCNFAPGNNYTTVSRLIIGSAYCKDKISVSVPEQYTFVVTCNLQNKK